MTDPTEKGSDADEQGKVGSRKSKSRGGAGMCKGKESGKNITCSVCW